MARGPDNYVLRVAIIYLVPFAFACSGGSAQEPKPIQEHELITEFRTPPATINEMILSADAVVVGRLTRSRPNDKQIPGVPAPRITTLWTLEIRDVLHYNTGGPIPQEMQIEREGGDRDRGTHIERISQRNFPDFQIGKEYVLFLRRANGIWWPAYGPDGAFLLSRGIVKPLGSSKLVQMYDEKAEDDFLRSIRNRGND